MWQSRHVYLTGRISMLGLLLATTGLFTGCDSAEPKAEDPVELVRNYWHAMEQGDIEAAQSYTLPGALAAWQLSGEFALIHVGAVAGSDTDRTIPVVIRLADGTEKDIETVLVLSEGDYWIDVEATVARSWRPEAAQLEKALLSEDGFEPDPGDGEVRSSLFSCVALTEGHALVLTIVTHGFNCR